MLRVIQTFKPTYIIAENVRGLLTINNGLVFEQVCLDLEASGYEVQPFIIPAVSVNAPHRRDRLWFIAYSKSKLGERSQPERSAFGEPQTPTGNGDSLTADTPGGKSREQTERQRGEDFSRGDWEANWLEVATELCGVDDGLPVELVEFKLTKSGHRVERLKSLGNSIVPQVAIEIFKTIKTASQDAPHSPVKLPPGDNGR
jgi:DNA (cytosine-5)-methyltransferase 1